MTKSLFQSHVSICALNDLSSGGIFATSISALLCFSFASSLIPPFTSFPPSLPWTQNALSLFPYWLWTKIRGSILALSLAHTHTHTQCCSLRCKRSSAVLIASLSLHLPRLGLWLLRQFCCSAWCVTFESWVKIKHFPSSLVFLFSSRCWLKCLFAPLFVNTNMFKQCLLKCTAAFVVLSFLCMLHMLSKCKTLLY